MTDRTRKLLAIYLSTVMVFSVLASATVVGPVAAATTNVGTVAVGTSPSVNVADATIDPSSDSNVSVAVNVSDEGVARNNVELWVYNDTSSTRLTTQSLDDANISGLSGTGNVSIPAGKVSNDFTLRVDAMDTSSQTPQLIVNESEGKSARGTSSITVSGGGGGGGGNTYINGTVTNTSGAAIKKAEVIAIKTKNGEPQSVAAEKTTDSNGNYNISVSAGTFWVIADNTPDHRFKFKTGKSVTAGSTLVVDFQLKEFPEKGWINGTYLDSNGNPVTQGSVDARELGYRFGGSSKLDSDGHFNISVPASNYRLTARPASPSSDVPEKTLENVTVREGQTTEVTIQAPETGFITGTVTDASGNPPSGAVQIIAEGQGRTLFNGTNSNGEYNITAPAGNYSVSVFSENGTAPSSRVTVTGNSETQADFTLKNVSIVHSSVEVINGSSYVDTGNVGIRARIDEEGLLRGTVYNTSNRVGGPGKLETLGANRSTEFRINLTVTNYSANALLWGIGNASWRTSDNASVTNGTDITITGTPVNLQATFAAAAGGSEDPYGAVFSNNPSWVSGWKDRADAARNTTIFFSVSSLSNLPDAERKRLQGVSVTTNAQKFTLPRVVNQTFSVWVAGPSKTIKGTDHTGFYKAEIPQSQLDHWNVTNPESELSVRYKGQQVDSTVTNTSSGATVLIENISYSAGFSDVQANPTGGGGGGGGDGGGSGGGSGGGGAGGGTRSGGGGGPATQVTTTQTEGGTEATIERVSLEDPTVTVATTGTRAGGVSVTEVSATFTKGTNSRSTLSVSASTSPPSGAGAPPGTDTVFSYVDVTVEGSLAKSISEGRFRVDISELDVEAGAVTAQRYDGTDWEEVETEAVDDSTVEIISPDGYSAFAIGASESSEPAQPTATPTEEEPETETPEETETPAATPVATATATPAAATATPAGTATPAATPTPGAGGPGFGALVALVALVAALVALRRR